MGMEGGYVAYVHKHAGRAAVQVIQPTRRWQGPHEIYDEGYTAMFINHLFITNDTKVIKAMDEHPKYGVTFQRVRSGEDLERIKRYGAEVVRFSRGPAQTLAEQLGAPRTYAPKLEDVSSIAPPPDNAPPPPPRRGRMKRDG